MADLLIKNGADVNVADDEGKTALHRAAAIGNTNDSAEIIK